MYPYYNIHSTYFKSSKYINNKHFHYLNILNKSEYEIISLIKEINPSIMISAIRGEFLSQLYFHEIIINYVRNNSCRIIYLSSTSVFDGYKNFPNYELDKTFSKSKFGYFKIKIENKLLQLEKNKYCLVRIPFVIGRNSSKINEIKNKIKLDIPIEVFPNLIVNIINSSKIALNIHHIVNKKINGVIHLGSQDLIQHVELIKKVIENLNITYYKLKYVYTSNENRYIALFSKNKNLPKSLNFNIKSIIDSLKLK